MIDVLSDKFTAIYGRAWTANHDPKYFEKILKPEWHLSFVQNLITGQDIFQALNYITSGENTDFVKFPPNLVQMIRLCRYLKKYARESKPAAYIAAPVEIQSDRSDALRNIFTYCCMRMIKRRMKYAQKIISTAPSWTDTKIFKVSVAVDRRRESEKVN